MLFHHDQLKPGNDSQFKFRIWNFFKLESESIGSRNIICHLAFLPSNYPVYSIFPMFLSVSTRSLYLVCGRNPTVHTGIRFHNPEVCSKIYTTDSISKLSSWSNSTRPTESNFAHQRTFGFLFIFR